MNDVNEVKDFEAADGEQTRRSSHCYPPGHPYIQIAEEMAAMSGLVLWRVKATWANKGRTGEIDCVVEASEAIEAVRLAWRCEDVEDLRNVSVEWLCPIESVTRR